MSWQIDKAHTRVSFMARHMMIAKVRGSFEEFSGAVDFDEKNPNASSLEAQIDVASVNTGDEQRDGHLRSPDFFDAENHPTITFISKRIETNGKSDGRVVGDLTIRGVTNEIVLDVDYEGQAMSPWGTVIAGFSASTTIDRRDWGLTWNQVLESGGMLLGDRITIEIEAELVKQQESQTEREMVAA